MSDQFVAEIRIFACNFAPNGWALCNGQLMPLSQNTALFSLLGTTYGGDGKSTFALPDLQRAAPMHPGQGSGALYDLGQVDGAEAVALLSSEMPLHTHKVNVSQADGTNQTPKTSKHATTVGLQAYAPTAVNTQLAPQAAQVTGGGLPHNNMQPHLVLNFCIALQGIFPPRT
jgi:microcystin-dependent protein